MIFKRLDSQDIVPASQTVVTTGMWSGDVGGLKSGSGFLYDLQLGKSGEYYVDVYDENPSTVDTAEIQFAIAYGHINGAGAPTLADEETAKLPTKTIYSQYRNLLLGSTDTKFKFNGVESDHVYIINLQRARIRQQLDPGNWQLPLSGANGVFTFIDDSKDTLEALTQTTAAGRVYKVISGSINTVSGSVTSSTAYGSSTGPGFGLVYPDLGIIVLNPEAICPLVGFYTSGSTTTFVPATNSSTGSAYSASSVPVYTSTNITNLDNFPTYASAVSFAPFTGSYTGWGAEKAAYNHLGLFTAIKKAITRTDTLFEFRARSRETISSTHYFLRLRNNEFNYSNNPTFRNPDDNTINISQFKSDPKVYITTIGLYNDNNELLAVGKLSKPVKKSFAEEILLRMRLDF